LDWVWDLFRGDLGNSIFREIPVTEIIIQGAEPTIAIGIFSTFVAIIIGIPLGVASGIFRYTPGDLVVTAFALFGFSMPAFFFAILLISLFSGDIFPAYGYVRFSDSGLFEWLRHITLPVLAVGIPYGAIISRHMRSSTLEVLGSDYLRTARAKGLDYRIIIFKHGLQNAIIPVITVVGLLLGAMFTGVVAVEIVFGINGFGRIVLRALQSRDFPLIQGSVVLVATILIFTNLFIDILYTFVNPKIRYGDEG
jgi:peptide/nickel transport system permease protein